MIFEIAATDVSSTSGYGEFDEENKAPFATFEEFVRETFNEDQEGYWHNWTQMFETTFLKKDYFDKIYAKIMKYASFCEGQRFLANNNTFFVNMIVDEAGKTYCADWGRAGIMELAEDFFLSPESIKKIVYGKKINLPEYSPSICSAKQYSDAGAAVTEEPDAYTDVPLIILFEDHRFVSLCGRRRLAYLRMEKKNAHWAFVFVRNTEYNYYLNNFGKQFQRGK